MLQLFETSSFSIEIMEMVWFSNTCFSFKKTLTLTLRLCIKQVTQTTHKSKILSSKTEASIDQFVNGIHHICFMMHPQIRFVCEEGFVQSPCVMALERCEGSRLMHYVASYVAPNYKKKPSSSMNKRSISILDSIVNPFISSTTFLICID